jgi:hypothetical protein
MPYTEVMHKFKHGELHSGSKSGPPVKNRKQAIAIMLSEKRAAAGGKEEYKSKKKKRKAKAVNRGGIADDIYGG